MYDNLITSDHLEQVVQKIQDTKASKSTTLSGYGITDSYTKTETDSRIQDIVGAAPEALDTLEEIAEALQDGESTAAGLVQTLSQKADKSTTVTNIAYGSKKLTKTINGSTTDVVTINAIKSDLALTKSDVGLSNVDNTSDVNKPVSNATQTALDTKVDKVSGKGLSTNDYTTTEKNKLSGIASNAQVNIIESIKVNNSVLPISSKSVNITVPTKTSELTNNSNFAVDSNYVHTDNNYTTAEKQKLASKVAELDSNGKVLSSQLPSYVDDVVEYTSLANFPTTGESGKIYVDTGTNLTYRWTGSAYREISPSLALGETGSTAYRGDRGKVAYTHATDSNRLTTAKTSGLYKISTTAEGHVASAETATKSDIGLGNVDNTSDLDKPISTATQEALNTKVNVTTSVLKSDEEFTYRQTGSGSLDIDAKYGKLKSIKGRTLVWNQLVQQSYGSTVTTNDVTITVASDGKFTLSGTANTSGGRTSYVSSSANRIHIISGHKYLSVNGAPSTLSPYVTLTSSTSTLFQVPNGTILTASTTFDGRLGFNVTKDINYDGVSFYLSLFDLTLMFGAGNEPTTPAEFEALYPGPYYDYNPGELVSNAATAIETVGWNIWDEEWEGGAYNDGVKVSDNSYIRSKNYIKVLPDTEYYYKFPKTGRISYFDDAKTFISSETVLNNTKTTPSNCYYITFHVSQTTTYANDICLSLSDPSRNGTYEPYWRSELELGLGDIKVKSHNIWDEEWEVGDINATTGANDGSTTQIRSKNYIPVEAGRSYHFVSKVYKVAVYNSEKQFIERIKFSSSEVDATIPSGGAYIRFSTVTTYGNTYLNNIAINLSDPAYNGRYEPYGDGGVISITGGLKSAGTVYDEISGGKYIKRVGSVDMGDLSYLYRREVEGGGVFSSTSIADKANGVSVQMYANVVCPMYVAAKSTTGVTLVRDRDNMTICDYAGESNIIYVKNLSYTGATAFKEAMAGVLLYYELTKPIEYELYNPIDLSYKVDKFGTEKLLPGSTSIIVSSPFRADIEYRTTNVTIDDVYGGSDIIKSVEDVDSRLTTVEKSINGLVTIGSGSPTTIPKNIGDFYIDVTNKVLYFATGNQLISDWNS